MGRLVRFYCAVFWSIERALDAWFLGLLARVVFAGTMLVYFLDSALTKVGGGPGGFFEVSTGAYMQILPGRMAAVGGDPAALAEWERVLVHVATYAEFFLPLLIVVGWFTRLASLGMIVFVVAMTWVQVTGHGVTAAELGGWFDREPNAPIWDVRALWMVLLAYLFVKGPGAFSLDWLFGHNYVRRRVYDDF